MIQSSLSDYIVLSFAVPVKLCQKFVSQICEARQCRRRETVSLREEPGRGVLGRGQNLRRWVAGPEANDHPRPLLLTLSKLTLSLSLSGSLSKGRREILAFVAYILPHWMMTPHQFGSWPWATGSRVGEGENHCQLLRPAVDHRGSGACHRPRVAASMLRRMITGTQSEGAHFSARSALNAPAPAGSARAPLRDVHRRNLLTPEGVRCRGGASTEKGRATQV